MIFRRLLQGKREHHHATNQRAADLPTGHRRAFLDQNCADAGLRAAVERLLELDESGAASSAEAALLGSLQLELVEPPIRRIGKYSIVRRIGHGGMGTVFEATQEQPFFAMELVRGALVTEFAAQRRLDTRARLGLMANICDAVQHAHQKGVIHRDLKPANILVTEDGEPKILDFGVARAADASARAASLDTATGQLIGTLPYMSPEQVSDDPRNLDTRSDVYALGVVLYELLTGSLPHDLRDRSIPEAALTIRDATPELLGSFDPSFRGDVETPVAKSLEKDRERRYASASELAADIRRYLDGQPIQARPATTLYQLRKFTTRHPALVGGLLATGAALLAGIGATSWQAYRATQAEAEMRVERGAALESSRLASQARQRADEVASFLLWGFGLDDANGSADGTLTILDMLALSTERMGEFYAGRPEAEANARRVVGDTYFMLGLNEQAVEQLTLACELSRGRPDMERVQHANLLVLNMAEREAGHGEPAAQRWIGEAVMVGRRILSERHPELEREVAEMTGALLIPTRPREQEIYAQLEDVLAALARAMPADHPDAYYVGSFLCLVSTYLGNTFGISTGRFRLQESAVAILRRLVPADPAQASYSQRHALVVYLWMLVRSQAPDGEEEPRVARARELHDLLQWFTGTPWLAVDIPGVLGDALLQRGFADDLPEAERLVLESCADVQRLLGERNIRSVIALERVARMYRNLNREEELLRTLQVVMSALKSCLDAEDLPREATGVAALDQLAWIVARQPGLRPEDYDLARVGAARAAQLEPTSWAFATIHGVALLRAGQPARALEVLRESDALLAGLPVTWACIAMAHEVLGEHEHALAALTHLRALPAVVEGALDEEDRLLLLEAERVVGAR